jgi:hypothetical protein
MIMKKINSLMMKLLPWLLIIFGFFTLNRFMGILSLTCMVIGITMLIERKWPEKWDTEQN